MEENKGIDQSELEKRNQTFESLKKFFAADMRIKQELLKLAPTEKDDASEESRMEYADKLYKAIRDLEAEFIDMSKSLLGENSNIIEILRAHFSKAKEAFLLGHYSPGVIQKLYREQFSDMSAKLVEKVKSEFVGYTVIRGNLAEAIKESVSINELLHVMHSYVSNDENLLKALPVIATKKNIEDYSVTLYGEETELSRKLFDEFPVHLDYVADAEIVSMPNKILMMIRDRGHALTVDMDTTKEDDIAVSYFVPKICNEKMVEALPGVNKSGISDNGATGLFVTSKEEMTSRVVDFIGKVPTDRDFDSEAYLEEVRQQILQEKNKKGEAPENDVSIEGSSGTPEKEPIFGLQDAQELAMEKSEKGTKIGIIKYLHEALRNGKEMLRNGVESLKKVFKGEDNDDRTNRD